MLNNRTNNLPSFPLRDYKQKIEVNKVAFVLRQAYSCNAIRTYDIRKDGANGMLVGSVNVDGFFSFKDSVELSTMAMKQMLLFVESQGKITGH